MEDIRIQPAMSHHIYYWVALWPPFQVVQEQAKISKLGLDSADEAYGRTHTNTNKHLCFRFLDKFNHVIAQSTPNNN